MVTSPLASHERPSKKGGMAMYVGITCAEFYGEEWINSTRLRVYDRSPRISTKYSAVQTSLYLDTPYLVWHLNIAERGWTLALLENSLVIRGQLTDSLHVVASFAFCNASAMHTRMVRQNRRGIIGTVVSLMPLIKYACHVLSSPTIALFARSETSA